MNFNGLYKKDNFIYETFGKANINKQVYKINDFTYHPYTDETPEMIDEEIKKTNKGWSFTLFEKDHGQREGDYYMLNKIKIGTPIERCEKEALLEENYTEQPNGIDLNRQSVLNSFNNYCYATMDFSEMDNAQIDRIYKRFCADV